MGANLAGGMTRGGGRRRAGVSSVTVRGACVQPFRANSGHEDPTPGPRPAAFFPLTPAPRLRTSVVGEVSRPADGVRMSDSLPGLLARVQYRTAVVGVIGLGYVGLPLARAFTAAGFRVLGFDIDAPKVEKLNAGKSFIKQIPDATVAEMRAKGFEATADFARLGEPDAVLICVPTPLTEAREPDPHLRRQLRHRHRRPAPQGAARGARKHHIPEHDAERHAPHPGAHRPRRRHRLLRRVQPGARRPRHPDAQRHPHPEGGRRPRTPAAAMSRARSTPPSCRRWCASRRRRWRRRARFWRTPTARSTSRS